MAIPRILVIYVIVVSIMLIKCNEETQMSTTFIAQNQTGTNDTTPTNNTNRSTANGSPATKYKFLWPASVFLGGMCVVVLVGFGIGWYESHSKKYVQSKCLNCAVDDEILSSEYDEAEDAERTSGNANEEISVDRRTPRRQQRAQPEPIAEVDDEREPTTPDNDLNPVNAVRSFNSQQPRNGLGSPGSESFDGGPIEMQVQVQIEPKPASPDQEN